MSEMTIDQLERIAAAETGRDLARERRESEDAMRLCDWLEEIDAERAADDFEALAWRDELTGFPIPGHESPRFLDARRREYRDWLLSREGERTRRNAHPELDARLRRAGRTTSEPATYALRDAETR